MTARAGVRRAGLGLLGLAAGLVAAELALRALAPVGLAAQDLRWVAHDTVGFRLQPGVEVRGGFGATINSLGLRGPEPGPARGAGENGVERVLCLGDSMTYGAGVGYGDTFPARLELDLAERGRPARAVNAGTPSYGTVHEADWLEAFGPELRPDVLVLAVCLANDVTDAIGRGEREVVDGRLYRAGQAPERAGLAERLVDLHLWRLWRRTFGRDADPEPTVAQPERARPVAPADEQALRAKQQADRRFRDLQAVRLWMYARPEFEEPAIGAAYAVQAAALERVQRWCEERDVRLIALLLPDVLAADAALFERVLADSGLPRDQGDLDRPRDAVRDWARGAEVELVDMTEPFRAAVAAGESPFLYRDIHLSPAGHAQVAGALAEAIAGTLSDD